MIMMIGDRVKTVAGAATPRTNGIVKSKACYGATTKGGKTCSKKNCLHINKDYLWVEWPDGSLFSYHEAELVIDNFIPSVSSASKVQFGSPVPSDEFNGSPARQDLNIHDVTISTEDIKKAFEKADGMKERLSKISLSGELSRPLEASEVDFEIYNGFKEGPGRSYNYRKIN